MLSPYVSVDCVLLGINDDKLTVLLAERKSEEGELIGYKLPGSLIYENEDLEEYLVLSYILRKKHCNWFFTIISRYTLSRSM